MGTQQFFILVISIVVVGFAIVVGVNIVEGSYADHINDIAIEMIHDIGLKANLYRKRPAALGGGGGSYKGFHKENKWVLKVDFVDKIKFKANKNIIKVSMTLKGGKKKAYKIEAKYKKDGLEQLRIYDPKIKKWVWYVKKGVEVAEL